MSSSTMTYAVASRNLQLGDIVRATRGLASDQIYAIRSNARFVVVKNDLKEALPFLALRLVPDDQDYLTAGNISEWGNCIEFYGPEQEGVGSDPGIADEDKWNPGHAWNKATLPLVHDNSALTTTERMAAVFTFLLAQQIGASVMQTLAALNETDGDSALNHYGLCDFRVLSQSFRAVMGRPNLSKADERNGICTKDEYRADLEVALNAVTVAKAKYLQAYARSDDADLADGVLYTIVEKNPGGDQWLVVRQDGEFKQTVAGSDSFPLSRDAAGAAARSLNDRRVTKRQIRTSAVKTRPSPRPRLSLSPGIAALVTIPLAAPLLDLLQHVGGWDLTDPEHPVVRARTAYEAATGVKPGPAHDDAQSPR